MVITNEIFEYYRETQRKVKKYKSFLNENGYIVYEKPKRKKKTD